MRLFININGIDVFYKKPQENGNIEVKIDKYDESSRKHRTASFLLPDVILIENNNFDESVINYMTGILTSCKEHIKEAAEIFAKSTLEIDANIKESFNEQII